MVLLNVTACLSTQICFDLFRSILMRISVAGKVAVAAKVAVNVAVDLVAKIARAVKVVNNRCLTEV